MATESYDDVTLDYLQANAVALRRGVVDDEAQFLRYVDYVLPDGRCYRSIAGGFLKQNPFEAVPAADVEIPIEVDGARSTRLAGELTRTTGAVDDDNEYTCWVEYRLPEREQPVHRSVHVRLKKVPGPASAVAGNLR